MRASSTVPPASCAIDRSARSRSTNRFGELGSVPLPITASQLWPYRLGVATRRSALAVTVSAAATAATPTIAASIVVRTGTAERPRPGSSAIRTPATPGADRPARASASTAGEDRGCPASARAREARHAGPSAASSTSAAVAAPPRPTTSQSTARPGSGSAARAAPIGASGERATAMAMASAPAASPMGAMRASAERQELTAGHPERPQERVVAGLQGWSGAPAPARPGATP